MSPEDLLWSIFMGCTYIITFLLGYAFGVAVISREVDNLKQYQALLSNIVADIKREKHG